MLILAFGWFYGFGASIVINCECILKLRLKGSGRIGERPADKRSTALKDSQRRSTRLKIKESTKPETES